MFRKLLIATTALILAACAAGCTEDVEIVPRVKITDPSRLQTGDVVITYLLQERDSRNASIVPEYSLDYGVTYREATRGTGGDGTEDLETTTSGMAHSFVWDTLTDLGEGNFGPVYFRITPWRGSREGEDDASRAFYVRNFELADLSSAYPLDNVGSAQGDFTATLDNEGVIFTAWVDGRFGTPRIFTAVSIDNATTFSAGSLACDPGDNSVSQSAPSLAAKPGGTVYLAWTSDNGSHKTAMLAVSADYAATFENAGAITDSGGETSGPVIHYDSRNRRLYAAWVDERKTSMDVRFGRLKDNGAWDEKWISDADGDQFDPRFARGLADRIFVTWESRVNGNSTIMISSGTGSDDLAFTAGYELSDAPEGFQAYDHDSLSSEGSKVFAAWTDDRGALSSVRITGADAYTLDFADSWVLSNSSRAAWDPSVSSDGSGLMLVAWAEEENSTGFVRLAYFDEADFPFDNTSETVIEAAPLFNLDPQPYVFASRLGIPVLFYVGDDGLLYYRRGEE